MHLFEFEGKRPGVHPGAFVAPTATLIGDVTVEKGASVWYGAMLRADICAIVVREGANVQDNSVVHAAPDQVVEIGPGATVAHSCVVHGAVLERHALLGNGSTMPGRVPQSHGLLRAAPRAPRCVAATRRTNPVRLRGCALRGIPRMRRSRRPRIAGHALDGSRLGAGSMVAAGSLVSPETQIPPGVLAAGSPAVVEKGIEGTAAEFWVQANPSYYAELAQRHLAGIVDVSGT